MKLRFKVQPYQTEAVNAVVDCFEGQPFRGLHKYRMDPGLLKQGDQQRMAFEDGFRNAPIELPEEQILENIRKVQKQRGLPPSQALTDFTTFDRKGKSVPVKAAYKKLALAASRLHLDVEMETGTGKTYVYTKTIFELNKRYGWSKFIIIVPSIAIREGVYKSFQITQEHFAEHYAKKARFFIYNSSRLHEVESFSSDSGINVMIMNIQAFNARGQDARRMFMELDDFQSRRPIDVIAANHPILILDEPQKMEGKATLEALPKFRPLFILRYSATHRTRHNLVHRLDAVDAYNQKLVKKIAVRGIQPLNLPGTNAYLYLEGIDTYVDRGPVARLQMEVKLKSGQIKRQVRRLSQGDNLFELSNGLEQYRGFAISNIDAAQDVVEFTNGVQLHSGQAHGDMQEGDIRRIQIRETIRAHLQREQQFFPKGIKVLSLFFIDEVVKYRDYDREDTKGEYARIFEEEYENLKAELLEQLPLEEGMEEYCNYLRGIDAASTHNGYFSIDKKGHLKDPTIAKRGEEAGLATDVDAYDLILKDKERLLSFEEPTRFIFSHSALREGWDNPNVFTLCMLKHSDNTISRRQEVGRGLRLCVNKHGERMDNPTTAHDINILTVVANESYREFVDNLQKEIAETLTSRPRRATADYFKDKIIQTDTGSLTISDVMARQIYHYLVKNDYVDVNDHVTDAYHEARHEGALAELPHELKPHAEEIFSLIDSVFTDAHLPQIDDGRKTRTNPLNANFHKQEFQALWRKINRKAIYLVDFDSDELIGKCVNTLNRELRVSPLRYEVREGVQKDGLDGDELRDGNGFEQTERRVEQGKSARVAIPYDLIGKIAEEADLTRCTVATILMRLEPAIFQQFPQNPEQFITEASRLIKEQKAATVIERLAYDPIKEEYETDIFTANQVADFSRAVGKLKKHIYDYAIVDSSVERQFVHDLDASDEVVVYAKLPRGFLIPTPVGDYNPDWAITFRKGSVKHIYFIAETKGSMSSLQLRGIEEKKIECARKFFSCISNGGVKYDVVTDYQVLMDIVRL